jgi:hypothetical protein
MVSLIFIRLTNSVLNVKGEIAEKMELVVKEDLDQSPSNFPLPRSYGLNSPLDEQSASESTRGDHISSSTQTNNKESLGPTENTINPKVNKELEETNSGGVNENEKAWVRQDRDRVEPSLLPDQHDHASPRELGKSNKSSKREQSKRLVRDLLY